MDPIWQMVRDIFEHPIAHIICEYYYPKFLCSYTAGKYGILHYYDEKKHDFINGIYFSRGLCEGGYIDKAIELYNYACGNILINTGYLSSYRDLILKYYHYRYDVIDNFLLDNIEYVNTQQVIRNGAINIYRFIGKREYECVLEYGTASMIDNIPHTKEQFYISLRNNNNIFSLVYDTMEDKDIDIRQLKINSIKSCNEHVIHDVAEKFHINYSDISASDVVLINKMSLPFMSALQMNGMKNVDTLPACYFTEDAIRYRLDSGLQESGIEYPYAHEFIHNAVYRIYNDEYLNQQKIKMFNRINVFEHYSIDSVFSCNIVNGLTEDNAYNKFINIANSNGCYFEASKIVNPIYYMTYISKNYNINSLNEKCVDGTDIYMINLYLFQNIYEFLTTTIYYPYVELYKSSFSKIKAFYKKNRHLCCEKSVFNNAIPLLNEIMKQIKIKNIGVDLNTESKNLTSVKLDYYNINTIYYDINRQLSCVGLGSQMSIIKKVVINDNSPKLDNFFEYVENILNDYRKW